MGLTRETIECDGNLLYKCTICKNFKEESKFEKRYGKNHIKYKNSTSLRSECKECRNLESAYYHRTVRLRMTKEQCEKDILLNKKYKADPLLSLKRYILRLTKCSAKIRNIVNTLTLEDIIIPELCPIFKVPFILNDHKYTYSVDRIDNTLGYIPGNVAVISNLANSMKRNATAEELIAFSNGVKDYIKI